MILTKKQFVKFRQAYTQAIATKEETFVWEGCVVLVDYAKYLIEYVEMRSK